MPTIRKMTILSFMSSWTFTFTDACFRRHRWLPLMIIHNRLWRRFEMIKEEMCRLDMKHIVYIANMWYLPPKKVVTENVCVKKENVYNKIANEIKIVALTTGKAWQNISEDLQLWPVVDASKPVASPWLKHTASLSKQNQCKGNNWSVEVNMYLCLQGLHEVGLLRCPQTTTEVKNRLKTSQVFFPPLQPVKSTACFRCEQHVSKPAVLSARTVS